MGDSCYPRLPCVDLAGTECTVLTQLHVDYLESPSYGSTSVEIIKTEVRCRDDTVPKIVDTRRHYKVGLRACNNLPQPPKTKM